MKRIISSVLVTALLVFLHSCRQQDEQDDGAMIDTRIMANNSLKSETSKESDTAQAIAPVKHPGNVKPETDPPPKDHDQWKVDHNLFNNP